jgi:hypothetical protein
MPIRGTVIIADQVYKTVDGKWVISGTYNNWFTKEEELHIPAGLHLYIRLLTESVGVYFGFIQITRDAADPRANAVMLQLPTMIAVGPEGVPVVEAKLQLPGMRIKGPPLADREPGTIHEMKTTLRLFLALGQHATPEEVAYAPLQITFLGPPPEVQNGHGQRSGDDRPDGNRP